MELDDTDTSHEPDELILSPIAETNPLTQEITANNANSRLLRLPQEIKQLIYRSILEGQLIHVHTDPRRPECSFTHYLCQAKHSEKEAERIFAASKEPWYSTEIQSRHEACYPPLFRDVFFQCCKQNDIAAESYAQLSLAFLRCCRQMYQEARSSIFSNCTFSFMELSDFKRFYNFTGSQIVSDIRSLHLDIMIDSNTEEYWWNETLDGYISELKSLQHIYINIDLHPEEDQHVTKRKFKEPAEWSFLEGLYFLTDLNLKTATVIISDYHISHPNFPGQRDGAERWTMNQKQEWAGYIKRALLHQEVEEQLALGDLV